MSAKELPQEVEESINTQEMNIQKELQILKGIRSIIAPTLITFDAPIPSSQAMLKKLNLEPDGWQAISTKDGWEFEGEEGISGFLKGFEKTLGRDLLSYMDENSESLRLGGSVFTTLYELLSLNPQIEKATCITPVGKTSGENTNLDKLIKSVNKRRRALISKLSQEMDGNLEVEETVCDGVTPICISFYQEKGRSMVMIKDKQQVSPSKQQFSSFDDPNLLLIDTRELISKSYEEAMNKYIERPNNLTVVGLGADSVLSQATDTIRSLIKKAPGEIAFSGNKGEMQALLKELDYPTPQKLILGTEARFALETHGQKGARLYLRVGDRVHFAEYAIPKKEIYKKDTTNAGDIFLAGVLSSLINFPDQEEDIESLLYESLKSASGITIDRLQKRSS